MYKLNYYSKTNEEDSFKYLGMSEFFRLRRNALHYLFEIVQSEYRENGYATEVRVGSLYCYRSEKDNKGNRIVKEILIKVEK